MKNLFFATNLFSLTLTVFLSIFVCQSINAQNKKETESSNKNTTITSAALTEDTKEESSAQLQHAFLEIINYANQLIEHADSLRGEEKNSREMF